MLLLLYRLVGKMSYSFKLQSHKGRLLINHLKNVGELSRRFINQSYIENWEDLGKISYLIGISHDFAKATTFFQEKLINKNYKTEKSDHSYLSSIFSYWLIKRYLKNLDEAEYATYMPYFTWLIVARHHGNLENWFNNENLFENIKKADYISEQIRDILENSLDEIQQIYHNLLENFPFSINISSFLENYEYIISNLESELEDNLEEFLGNYIDKENIEKYLEFILLYSSLIDADRFDASCESEEEFHKMKDVLFDRKDISAKLVDEYKKVKFNQSDNFSVVKGKAYMGVVQNINNIDIHKEKILSINLPTGAGKTLSAFSFALKLRNKIQKEIGVTPKIIYSLPFLSIIDQNSKVLAEVLAKEVGLEWNELFRIKKEERMKVLEDNIPTNLLLKHHHLADIKYIKEDANNENLEEFEKDKALSLIDSWYSEVIITSFVQFFQSLISNKNRAIRKVHNIPNSIIILDEFQSIPHKYWGLTRKLLRTITEKWNCYIIIITATMPMILDKNEIKSLIKNPDKYFKNKNFNRVEIFVDREEKGLNEFAKDVFNSTLKSAKDVMIIVNTIKSSQEIYLKFRKKLSKKFGEPKITNKGIADFGEFYLINLNTNIIPFHRLKRIEKIKNSNKRKIIISTQLVEAGVNIDIDVIYRDLAPIDSLVQSAGRCNRNNKKKKGEMYIVKLKDENNCKFSVKIYGNILIEATESILKNYTKLQEEQIKGIVEKYFEDIKERKDTESKEVLKQVCNLEFDKIKDFSLIEKQFGKGDICVVLDNVNEIINKIVKKKKESKECEYREKFTKIAEIKSLRRKLEQFIISPFVCGKESYISDIYDNRLSIYILNPNKRKIYDEEIGFNPKNDASFDSRCV